MTKHEVSCGAIVFHLEDNQPKYLVIQHQNGGHWAFTKGHTENDETEEETALREINEETGMDTIVLDTGFRHVLSYFPKAEVEKKVIYFVAEVSKNESKKVKNQEAEILDSQWLSYVDAMDLITYNNDRELLEKAHHYIENDSK